MRIVEVGDVLATLGSIERLVEIWSGKDEWLALQDFVAPESN